MGAREPCACSTMRVICASTVASPSALRLAHHRAVVVERAGQHAAAHLAGQRSGLAGKHRFIHRGAALKDHCVHRKALTGKDQHAVAGLDLFERHNRLDAVHYATRRDRPQPRQGVECRQRAPLGTGFKRFAEQQKTHNQ